MTQLSIRSREPGQTTAPVVQSSWSRSDLVLAAATLIYAALALTTLFLPAGRTLPTLPLMLEMIALLLMLGLHMIRHLGVGLAGALLLMGAATEFLSEIINAHSGLVYGPFFYTDGLGPRVFGVPFTVPLVFAIQLWPTYAVISILLNGRMVSGATDRIGRVICFCLVGGLFSSSIWFTSEPLCINMDFFHYINVAPANSYFGANLRAVHGWAAVVAIQLFIFLKLLVPKMGALPEKPLHPLLDAVPFLYMGSQVLLYYVHPVNRITGTVTLWALGTMTLASAFRFGPAIAASRERSSAETRRQA